MLRKRKERPSATPEPNGEWPDGYPQWSGGGGTTALNDDSKYEVPLDEPGVLAVSATCGSSTKTIKIVVVKVVISNKGRDITDQVQDEIIGRKIALSVSVQPTELEFTKNDYNQKLRGNNFLNYYHKSGF